MHLEPRPTYSPEGIAATILFAVLLGVVVLQIVGRVGLIAGPVWTEELSRWIWVWMAFIGLGEVERTNSHLRVTFIAEALPALVQRVMFMVMDLIYLAITCHLIWIGYRGVLRSWNNTAVTLAATDGLLYASYPLAALFVVWRIVARLRRRVAGQENGL